MPPRKQTLNNINEICINLTRLHVELIKFKEYIDNLRCDASAAVGEQDKPIDCIEEIIAKYGEQDKLIDTLLGKQAAALSLLFDILDAYDKKDVTALEQHINEIRKLSKLII
jgi:hypothetical protein